jgi:hypothetical protein
MHDAPISTSRYHFIVMSATDKFIMLPAETNSSCHWMKPKNRKAHFFATFEKVHLSAKPKIAGTEL